MRRRKIFIFPCNADWSNAGEGRWFGRLVWRQSGGRFQAPVKAPLPAPLKVPSHCFQAPIQAPLKAPSRRFHAPVQMPLPAPLKVSFLQLSDGSEGAVFRRHLQASGAVSQAPLEALVAGAVSQAPLEALFAGVVSFFKGHWRRRLQRRFRRSSGATFQALQKCHFRR